MTKRGWYRQYGVSRRAYWRNRLWLAAHPFKLQRLVRRLERLERLERRNRIVVGPTYLVGEKGSELYRPT